jgi:tetratricopeptide (TPR) repeat protein/uncharacterized protein YrzB (UPF0473 family)
MSSNQVPANPYVIGVPLTGEAGFYGREDAFDFIEDILETEQQNVVVFYGQRRVGKTSLLHQIARKIKQKGAVVPVYFDLQGKEQKSLSEVLYDLSRTVARSLKIEFPKQDRFDDTGRYFRNEFLLSVNKRLGNKRLLLLFDEFDVLGDEITKTGTASETLFPYLQNLIMHQRQIVFVFVVGRRIEELTTHFHSIFKQAAYRQIGLLTENNARNLIVEPVKDFLTYEDSAIESILNLTSGHPYFTQLICFESFNDAKKNAKRVVSKADIYNLVDQTIESGHGALNWFWDGLPRAERFIMAAVAHVSDKSGMASQEDIRRILEKHKIILTGLELTDAPGRLVDWDMLRHKPDSDNYYFVIELVRRWILKSHPLESARRDVDLISKRATRLYENARDAHTDGDLDYARDEYQRALSANPNHSGAQLGLAQVLFELGNVESAIEEFEKAYSIDEISARDGLVRARQKYGKILGQKGKENDAMIQYELALKIAPSNEKLRLSLADIWRVRGDKELAKKDLARSIDNYKKALSFEKGELTNRKIRDSLITYAGNTEAEGEDNEAALAVERLKSLLPEDVKVRSFEIEFWTRRGDEHAKDNNKGADAIKAYKRALELSPNDKTLAEKLKAISGEWEKLLEADNLFKKGRAAHQDGNWSEAEAAWLQMIKIGFLEYKSNNIAEFLAEAHNRLSKRPSIKLKLVSPPKVAAGKEAIWNVILHNDGNDDLSDVIVTFDGNQKSDPIVLQPDKENKIKFFRTFQKAGQKTVKAAVTAVSSDGKVIDSEEAIVVDVLNPSIKLKLMPPREVAAGKEAIWNVTLHNDGNDDLSDVIVTFDGDQKSDPIVLQPDKENKIKFSRTFQKAGQKTVKAVVTAVSGGGKAISSEETIKIEVSKPVIKLKLIPPREMRAGKEATWVVILGNDGNEDLNDVVVTFDGNQKSDPIFLKPNNRKKVEFTRMYEKEGRKTIHVSVTAISPGGEKISGEETIAVDVLNPSIKLKLVPPEDLSADKEATWTVNLHNDGNDDLRNIVVTFDVNQRSAPRVLRPGKKTKIKFSRTFRKAGRKKVEASVTAVSAGGAAVNSKASVSVDVRKQQLFIENGEQILDQIDESADIKSEKKGTPRQDTLKKREDAVSAKSDVTLGPSLLIAAIAWAGAGIIFTYLFIWVYLPINLVIIPTMAIGGLATQMALLRIIPDIQRNRIFFALFFWAIGGGIIWIVSITFHFYFWAIEAPFGMAVGGSLAANSLRRSVADLQWKRIILVGAGWYAGWIIGWIVCLKIIWPDVFYNMGEYIGSGLVYIIFACFWAVIGVIGSWVMFKVIKKGMRSR